MSLRTSMYTGLAHPEVKTKGLSCEKWTAFTSSIIFAVMSAMKDLSAKSMGKCAILAGSHRHAALESPPWEHKNNDQNDRSPRCARARAARRRRPVLPLHRQGRQALLRLH